MNTPTVFIFSPSAYLTRIGCQVLRVIDVSAHDGAHEVKSILAGTGQGAQMAGDSPAASAVHSACFFLYDWIQLDPSELTERVLRAAGMTVGAGGAAQKVLFHRASPSWDCSASAVRAAEPFSLFGAKRHVDARRHAPSSPTSDDPQNSSAAASARSANSTDSTDPAAALWLLRVTMADWHALVKLVPAALHGCFTGGEGVSWADPQIQQFRSIAHSVALIRGSREYELVGSRVDLETLVRVAQWLTPAQAVLTRSQRIERIDALSKFREAAGGLHVTFRQLRAALCLED